MSELKHIYITYIALIRTKNRIRGVMKLKVARTIVINKQVEKVVNELTKEGWKLVYFDGEKAFLRPDWIVKSRIMNARLN